MLSNSALYNFLELFLDGGFQLDDYKSLHEKVLLGGGFKYFFIFTPIWGTDPILTNIF